MPTLNSHTHCQAAQASRTSQSLSKSVSEPTHARHKRKYDCTTWYIKNWADGVNFQGFGSYQTLAFGGQVIAPKCPTFHIPGPLYWRAIEKISQKHLRQISGPWSFPIGKGLSTHLQQNPNKVHRFTWLGLAGSLICMMAG